MTTATSLIPLSQIQSLVRTVRGTVRVQVVGFRTSMEGLGLPVLPLRQGLKSENPDG